MKPGELVVSSVGGGALMFAPLLLLADSAFIDRSGGLIWLGAVLVIGATLFLQWRFWWLGRRSSGRADTSWLMLLLLESGWALLALGATFCKVFGFTMSS